MAPALFTRMSSSPASAATRRTAASDDRSAEIVRTFTCRRARIAAAASSSAPWSRATSVTSQPSSASSSAVARPMPFEPPVISAFLPASCRSISCRLSQSRPIRHARLAERAEDRQAGAVVGVAPLRVPLHAEREARARVPPAPPRSCRPAPGPPRPAPAPACRSPGRAASSPGSSCCRRCARAGRTGTPDAAARTSPRACRARAMIHPAGTSCTFWCSVPPRATFSSWMPRQIASSGMPRGERLGDQPQRGGVALQVVQLGREAVAAVIVRRMHVARAAGQQQAVEPVEHRERGLAHRRDHDRHRPGAAQHRRGVARRRVVAELALRPAWRRRECRRSDACSLNPSSVAAPKRKYYASWPMPETTRLDRNRPLDRFLGGSLIGSPGNGAACRGDTWEGCPCNSRV